MDDSDRLSAVLTEAVQSLAQGQMAQARARSDEALELDPAHPDALHLRGVIAYHEGRLADAAEALRAAVVHEDAVAAYYVNLGNVLRALDEIDGAEAAYREALTREPTDARICCNLGGLLSASGRVAEAMVAYRDAIARDESLAEGYQGLAWCLTALAREDELPALMERWYAACPDDAVARYFADPTAHDDPEAIAAYFDRFAESYDHVLGTLGDSAPEQLSGLIAATLGSTIVDSALDVGCGTGRMAPFLRPRTHHLHGIDLSLQMIARARVGGAYDALSVTGLAEFAQVCTERFALVVLADVTGYLDDLGPAMKSVATLLRPEGLMFMTVERLDERDAAECGATGRWRHGEAHVARALAAAGLERVAADVASVRVELGHGVEALLVAARLGART